MLTAGIVLFIIGVLGCFSSFIFVVLNMVSTPLEATLAELDQNFKRRTLTLIPMALGALLMLVGLILVGAYIVQSKGVL